MLRVEGLSAAYGPVRALDAVDLEVPAGRVTAVLGANGAGKTTLLRVLSGLVRPSAGTVRFDGDDLARVVVEDRVRRGMGHVPEGRGVIGELSVVENLRLGALWRKDRADRTAALDEVLELFPPLVERRERAASTLSGGERQMLSVGRALMGRPKLLLLDEPSLGLAPQVAAQIMALLRRLCESAGLTVLLVEQNARSALSIADHGVVLNLGRVVADGAAADLLTDEGLRRAYLGF